MRIVFLVMFTLVLVSVSRAELGDFPNQLGIYFDQNADAVCAAVGPDSLVALYFVITNPSEEEIWGIEFGYQMVVVEGNEEHVVLYETIFPPGSVDRDPFSPGGGFVYTFPVLPTGGAPFVVLEMLYLFSGPVAVEFYLGPYPHDTLEYPAYGSDQESATPLGVASGDYSLPVASINGECTVLDVKNATFGDIKCLFR